MQQLPAIDSQSYPIATVAVLGHLGTPCGPTGEEDGHGIVTQSLHAVMVAGYIPKGEQKGLIHT